jgi:pantoate--beta-alanine ligase
MLQFTNIASFHEWRAQCTGPVLFVPTMGALHEGHLQLMREARIIAGKDGHVIVSIFVNPLQFGPREDFSKYPRELEADAEKCDSVGVDAIFAPSAEEMYMPDRSVIVLEAKLSKVLCGASRPGHFDGVCTIVLKLLNLVRPHTVVFGKKDYQQLAIIKRMVRDLNVPVEIIGSETVREPDGLAMSSRNRYLSEDERKQAPAIRQALLLAKQSWLAGESSAEELKWIITAHLEKEAPLHRADYIACVNRHSLEAPESVGEEALLAAAIYFGKTRLIDNLELL